MFVEHQWEGSEKDCMIIRMVRGLPIGSINVCWYDDRTHTGEIWALFVKEEYRRCGYGRELLRAAQKYLYRQGVRKVTLNAHYNDWPRHWYKSEGFEIEEKQDITMVKTLTCEYETH